MHKELLRTAKVFAECDLNTQRERRVKKSIDKSTGTLTVLALGDSEPLDRYGLVRSGIMRNG